MRFLKVFCIILLALVLAFVFGYMIYACTRVNQDVEVSEYFNSIFYSQDKSDYVYFKDSIESCIFKLDGVVFYPDSGVYEEGIFTYYVGNEEYQFLGVDSDDLYYRQNNEYFHRWTN